MKKHDTYRGCVVCDKWLHLSRFLEDLKYIKGYDKWESCVNERVCLDKDMSGKKIYSLDTCQFISSSENAKEAQFRNNRNKQVVRISKDGSVKIYESTIAPQHEDGFSQSSVSDCCRGKQNAYKGYKWMFLEDYKKYIEN